MVIESGFQRLAAIFFLSIAGQGNQEDIVELPILSNLTRHLISGLIRLASSARWGEGGGVGDYRQSREWEVAATTIGLWRLKSISVAQTMTGWTQDDAVGKPPEAILKIVNEATRSRPRIRPRKPYETASSSGWRTIRC